MCSESNHTSIWGMGFVSNVLRYFICELLVASEAFKMNKIFVSNISNLIKKYNVAQLYHFSAFLALKTILFWYRERR